MKTSLELNKYSVSILKNPGGFFNTTYEIDQNGYIKMKHGDQYKIQMKNNTGKRCNATVYVDGKSVGTWRINAWSTCTVERPAEIDKKFTFFLVGSSSGNKAGLSRGNSDNGLVQIHFVPEKVHVREAYFCARSSEKEEDDCDTGFGLFDDGPTSLPQSSTRSFSTKSTNSMRESYRADSSVTRGRAGGTGLQGQSSQQFGVASWMDLDYDNKTTITIRLIGYERENKNEVTPLPGRVPVHQTSVPAPMSY